MKLNKKKYKVMHLGKKSPVHQHMLGAIQLEYSFTGKDWGSWRTSNETQAISVPLWQRELMVSRAA